MSRQDRPLLSPNPWPARRRAAFASGAALFALTVFLFGFLPVSGAPPSILERVKSAVIFAPATLTDILFAADPSEWWTGVGSSVQSALRYAVITGIVVGIGYAVLRRGRLRPTNRLNATLVSGAMYADGASARQVARRLLAEDRELSGPGIALSPDILLPRNREIQSLIVVGRPRYGKSTALRFMLDSILARPSDKLIVYDSKGDVTAEWPGEDVVFLAPHDTRSWGWAVGRDILGETGARELAASLIQVSEREPNWTLGGQEILVAVIRSLQATRGRKWSWQEFGELLDLPDQELRELAFSYHRPALRYLTLDPETGEFDRTASSYVSTAMAPIQRIVRPLAQAWSGLDARYQISLREWLRSEKTSRRTIIVQRAAHLPSISSAWITAVLETMARYCVGPALADSAERRIWFVLDEFSTVPRIEAMPDLLAQGPSKGVCCLLACQNLELVEERYGPVLTKSMVQNTDLQILFRMNPGPTATYLTGTAIPKSELLRHRSHTAADNKTGAGAGEQKAEKVCLVSSHDLATLKRGEAFVILEGSIVKTRWPKSTWAGLRPPMLEAEWVSRQSPTH